MEPAAGAYDKVPLKFAGWGDNRFREAGFRAVPGAVVRRSAYIAPGVVLMPSFVNVGAYVGRSTMVDTWATVGSCAQIGAQLPYRGGVGIGGVLEPLQANPVIIEDDCFIGARSEVAEGVIVERGAVLSMGVFLGASTKIVDRATGEMFMAACRPIRWWCPGSLPGKPLPDGTPGPVARLRGDRQARRRADAGEDLDQRIAPRLTRAHAPEHPRDPLRLAQALIRCAVGHAGGCRRAGGAGRRAGARSASRFTACASARSRICTPASATGGPAFLLRRPHRCGAAGRGAGAHDPFAAEVADGMLYGRGACDMKGAIAAFVAAAAEHLPAPRRAARSAC